MVVKACKVKEALLSVFRIQLSLIKSSEAALLFKCIPVIIIKPLTFEDPAPPCGGRAKVGNEGRQNGSALAPDECPEQL